MRHALWIAPILLVPQGAWAIDTAPDSNTPIQCTGGTEVYYPRGDSWAFLPDGATASCHGTDPVITNSQAFYEAVATGSNTATNWAVDARATDPTHVGTTAADPEDTPGHCLWVYFSDGAPKCTNNCPTGSATEPDAGELANMTVFADMRKWTGYNSGQQTIPSGSSNLQWTCPSGAATSTSDASSIDYTFGVSENPMPSVSYYRGKSIAQLDSNKNYNKGDTMDCFAPCASGQNCSGPCTMASPACNPAPNPMLYACDFSGHSTDNTQAVYRFQSVRNVVNFVNGSGDWASKLGYSAETLAVTETIFWPDTGVSITSDMMINNDNVDWQWKDMFDTTQSHSYFGCNAGDPNCYYLETVTTHESGHFIGFGHVACQNAVMFSTADTTTQLYTLGVGEQAGVCSLYRPVPSSNLASPTRSASGSRDAEGCLQQSDCPAGDTCLFSTRSFYGSNIPSPTNPANWPTDIPHRGVCGKPCKQNSDCTTTNGGSTNYYGRICQPYDAAGTQSYCLPGSPYLPQTSATEASDLCAACASGSDCSTGVCINLVSAGVSAANIPADAPASICSVQCYPASGCDSGYECLQAAKGGQYGCVPLDIASCVQAAENQQLPLDAVCSANTTCASGLICYALLNADACLQECDAQSPCATPGDNCLLVPATAQATGQSTTQATTQNIGACFREAMKEGDSCALPETATCGLTCTTASGSQASTCVQNQTLGCFGTAPTYADAACYSLCSTQDKSVPCPHSGQTCTALPSYTNLGVCEPLSSHFCLSATGVICAAASDCASGVCSAFGSVQTCTNYCDLLTKTGCPAGTQCIDTQLGGGEGECAPTGKPLANNCPPASGSGCGCNAEAAPLDVVALGFAALVSLVARRRRVIRPSPIRG